MGATVRRVGLAQQGEVIDAGQQLLDDPLEVVQRLAVVRLARL